MEVAYSVVTIVCHYTEFKLSGVSLVPRPRLAFRRFQESWAGPGNEATLVYLLRVDLVFSMESPESVSCDSMTNVGSILMRTADVNEGSTRRDRRNCIGLFH